MHTTFFTLTHHLPRSAVTPINRNNSGSQENPIKYVHTQLKIHINLLLPPGPPRSLGKLRVDQLYNSNNFFFLNSLMTIIDGYVPKEKKTWTTIIMGDFHGTTATYKNCCFWSLPRLTYLCIVQGWWPRMVEVGDGWMDHGTWKWD